MLRVETTINDVDDFKTFHAPENKPDATPIWQRILSFEMRRVVEMVLVTMSSRRSASPPFSTTP